MLRSKLETIAIVFVAIVCAYFGVSVVTALSKPGSVAQLSLFSDSRAQNVGDIIKVIVLESASAKRSASTQTSRSSEKKGMLNALPGLKNNPLAKGVDLSSDNSFNGSGSVSAEGELKAEVAATVTEVLPNGNLVIEGVRQIVINGEIQTISVKGTVRPSDITPDNTVLSTNLADSEIRYDGKGLVARQQKPGFISRLLDWLWIF